MVRSRPDIGSRPGLEDPFSAGRLDGRNTGNGYQGRPGHDPGSEIARPSSSTYVEAASFRLLLRAGYSDFGKTDNDLADCEVTQRIESLRVSFVSLYCEVLLN